MLAETICRIKKIGLMGTVRVGTVERGIKIAQGCVDGGADVLEVSYTNSNIGKVIRALREKLGGQLLVGAGTVLDSTTTRLAIVDGVEFIIASTFGKEVQEMANLYWTPYALGCTSCTEMTEALKVRASFIKAFPIPNHYGPDLTEVFKMPCPQIPTLTSGGANFDNLHTWFESGADSVGLGGLLTKGSSADIVENVRGLRAIMEESKKTD